MKYGYFIGIVIFSITTHQLSFGMANKRKSQSANADISKKVKIPSEVSKEALCYWASRLKTPRPEAFEMDANGIPKKLNRLKGRKLAPYKTDGATIEHALRTSHRKYVVTVERSHDKDWATTINLYDAQTRTLLNSKQVTKVEHDWWNDDSTYFSVQDLVIDPTDSWITYAWKYSIVVLDMMTLGSLVNIKTLNAGLRLWFSPEARTTLYTYSPHHYRSHFEHGLIHEEKLEKYDLTAFYNLENMVENPTRKQVKLLDLYKNERYKEAETFLNFSEYRKNLMTSDHFKLLAKRAKLCALVEKNKIGHYFL